jgi:hypothetical protein
VGPDTRPGETVSRARARMSVGTHVWVRQVVCHRVEAIRGTAAARGKVVHSEGARVRRGFAGAGAAAAAPPGHSDAGVRRRGRPGNACAAVDAAIDRVRVREVRV